MDATIVSSATQAIKFESVADAVECLMIVASQIDTAAAKEESVSEKDSLAADRALIVAVARRLESRMDDRGTFNAAAWEPAALRKYVVHESIAADTRCGH